MTSPKSRNYRTGYYVKIDGKDVDYTYRSIANAANAIRIDMRDNRSNTGAIMRRRDGKAMRLLERHGDEFTMTNVTKGR